MMGYIEDIRGQVGNMPIILNASAGVITNKRKELLLQKRVDTSNWSLPGGYLEYGESYLDALYREVTEDCGFKAEDVKALGNFMDFVLYPNGDKAQVFCNLYLINSFSGNRITTPTKETITTAYFAFNNLPPLFNGQNRKMINFASTLFE
ncbi:NUDIX domain-containing protein [Lactobacillus sp. UCMA15818]|uniref:NUDIX domain-containing protein n=1 Tax=Lactobacillaceae TaxID=33958 RepID=UPI0025B21853|nr:NUDIX domain-containing protein [Lactobacillus sp. UCMA15818]MDN2453778.1 NUDIX domain-containing protein [Lactobacillus sp. UCMA15818]